MENPIAILRKAVSLHQKGELAGAERLYRTVLETAPDNFDALHFCGIACGQQGRFDEAAALVGAALKIRPGSANAHNSMAKALNELGKFAQARMHGRQALTMKPDYIDAHNNLGNALAGLERYEEAADIYRHALSIQPDSAESWNNLGAVLRHLEKYEEALSCMRRALEIQPDYAKAYHNFGVVLHRLKQYPEAAENFRRALELQPLNPAGLSMLVHLRMKMCEWRGLDQLEKRLVKAAHSGDGGAVLPFTILAVTDDPATQFASSRQYSADSIGRRNRIVRPPSTFPDGRIRVAYLSADFHQHATAYLMAEMFERHDRDNFEITAISYGHDDKSAMRQRLRSAFDYFIDARANTDREIARMIGDRGIQIAVDLKGYTQDCRPAVLAHRPAPIQVNFLGYPGTMGADFVDYILADPFVAPFDKQPFYSERIVQLPNCYQPNDGSRQIAPTKPSRTDQGLPEEGFVFCSFNKGYKITPDVFEIWMRLLQKLSGSVLWLFSDNPEMEKNLKAEAQSRGVDPDRLVFATHLPLAEHLARHRLADLFLDTFPCNAHTTASDALWAGLPVVTCAGRSFASRVAGSLLNAVGLSDLVADSFSDYETLALKLAIEPDRLEEIRSRLVAMAPSAPLFDSERFCRNLESAYGQMWERLQRGEGPEPFAVEE